MKYEGKAVVVDRGEEDISAGAREARRASPNGRSAAWTLLRGGGQASVRVSAGRVVTVEMSQPLEDERPPLVLLMDDEGRREPAVAALEPSRAGYLEARFDPLRPGSYLLLFEPLSTD
jgi:hypothetical protein